MADAHNPMAQFEIKRLIPMEIGGLDVSLTNSGAFMLVSATLVITFLMFSMRRGAMVPGRWQSMAEMSYEFIANMLQQNVGSAGRQYFPFIFTLFMFILACNLVGLAPYSFTVTSHIAVTFALAITVFIGVTIVGFVKNGVGFLKFFVPSGVPAVMLVLLVPIEVLSYFIRPMSLSVRLFANMLAGHTLLKVFGGFVISLGLLFGWVPFVFIIAFTGLELLIAFLQAYVFTILACLYLNDALNMHH